MPSTPAQAAIKEEWKNMVESGEISNRVSCVPYKMEKFSTKNGQLAISQSFWEEVPTPRYTEEVS